MDKQNYYPIYLMPSKIKNTFNTNDPAIRQALIVKIVEDHKDDPAKIIEELGINHGSVRADIAAVNGIMHCYEIKSDRDTLLRLPGQIKAYNAVFDRVTIVVGYTHIYDAIELVPEWWGITVAKENEYGTIVFSEIRSPMVNSGKDGRSIARLLWREEALAILEELNQAHGYRSKPRSLIYEKLAACLDTNALADRVKEVLCLREAWRVPVPQV